MDLELEDDLFEREAVNLDVPEESGGFEGDGDGEVGKKVPVKPKMPVRRPRLKLDPDRLCGERGIPAIDAAFQNVSFKGKGHEKEDLDKLMHVLEHWAFRLYPKLPFDEVLNKVQELGSKRAVQVCVKKHRMGLLGESDLVITETEDVIREESENEEEFVDPFDKLVVENHFPQDVERPPSPVIQTSTPVLTKEQVKRIEKNRLLAQERRKSRNNVVNEGASCSNTISQVFTID